MLLKIEGKNLEINNPEKVFWPEEGITKIELIHYYQRISPYILPYLKDRPQNLNRFPNGIKGESFYHKNLKGVGPEWLKKIDIAPANDKDEEYLVVDNVASLVFIISLGGIEINPWSSRIQHLEKPDWAVIDLDPEDIDFSKVIKAAKVSKEVLDQIGAKAFLKTSGATGLHIYIPFEARYTYEQIKNLTHLIVMEIHNRLPQITSLERLPKKRQGKIYLDYLQNNKGQTLAAPYSVRPRPGAPVSTPLKWEELDRAFKPDDFNMGNIFKRLEREGDLFGGVLTEKNDFNKLLTNIEKIIPG